MIHYLLRPHYLAITIASRIPEKTRLIIECKNYKLAKALREKLNSNEKLKKEYKDKFILRQKPDPEVYRHKGRDAIFLKSGYFKKRFLVKGAGMTTVTVKENKKKT